MVVCNQQIGFLAGGDLQRFLAVSSGQHLEPGVAQLQRHDVEDVRFIVGDENGLFTHDFTILSHTRGSSNPNVHQGKIFVGYPSFFNWDSKV